MAAGWRQGRGAAAARCRGAWGPTAPILLGTGGSGAPWLQGTGWPGGLRCPGRHAPAPGRQHGAVAGIVWPQGGGTELCQACHGPVEVARSCCGHASAPLGTDGPGGLWHCSCHIQVGLGAHGCWVEAAPRPATGRGQLGADLHCKKNFPSRERRPWSGIPPLERWLEPFPERLTPPLSPTCWERWWKIAPREWDWRRVRIQEGDLEKRHREGPSMDHNKAGEEARSGLCHY